jgi:ionotropic glutamate receptor
MSTAILKLSESGELQKIHDKWLSRKACSSEGTKQNIDRLPLKSFWGLFLLCGFSCFAALLLYVIKMVHLYTRHSSRSSKSFLSFVKEKEKDVHKMEDPEKMRKRRKRPGYQMEESMKMNL